MTFINKRGIGKNRDASVDFFYCTFPADLIHVDNLLFACGDFTFKL